MVQIIGDRTIANIKVLAPLIYIFPLFTFYFVILFILICLKGRSQFSSWFFTYFKIGLLHNIGAVTFYYIFIRSSQAPFFLPIFRSAPESGFIITIIPFLCYYFTMGSNITDAVLALNRFSVFVLKRNYNFFWRRYGSLVLAFILVFPGVANFHFFFTGVKIKVINESDPDYGYRWDEFEKKDFSWMNNAFNNMLLSFVVASICIFCNLFIVFKLWMRKIRYGYSRVAIDTQEMKLFFYTIFCAILHAIFITQEVQ